MNARGSGNGRSETWKTWVPPIIAAALTAILGGLASWWIQSCNEASEAENTARVLDQKLIAANDAMVRSMLDRRYRFYDLKMDFPLDDQKRLADELDGAYEDVARAVSAYSLQVARAREEHVFAQFDEVQLACAREKLAHGRWALREITKAPRQTLPERRKLEQGCETEEVELAAEQYFDDFLLRHPEHTPDRHPQSNAMNVKLEDDLRSATVSLEDDRGNRVGRLSLKERDGEWQVEKRLEPPDPVRAPLEAKKPGMASQ